MNDDVVKNWVIKAINDYKTAEKLINLPENEIITDTLCFHCQQFVEKLLKAYLILHNKEFKKVHDMEYLVKLCTDISKDFEWLNEAAKILSIYSVEIRYPDGFYIPTIKEAENCFELIQRVKSFLMPKLGFPG